MDRDTNIVLIGMPGAGKSTLGVLLAKELSRSFLDTDIYIQAREGLALQSILEEQGSHPLSSGRGVPCLCRSGSKGMSSQPAEAWCTVPRPWHISRTGASPSSWICPCPCSSRGSRTWTRAESPWARARIWGISTEREPPVRSVCRHPHLVRSQGPRSRSAGDFVPSRGEWPVASSFPRLALGVACGPDP